MNNYSISFGNDLKYVAEGDSFIVHYPLAGVACSINGNLSDGCNRAYALPFGVAKRIKISMIAGVNHILIHGGLLAVGEVITSSVKKWLKSHFLPPSPEGKA